jgi:hypothetical protein
VVRVGCHSAKLASVANIFLAVVPGDLEPGRALSERLIAFGANPVPRLHEQGADGSFRKSDLLASAVKDSQGLVAIVSEKALNSGWWHDALHYAQSAQIPVYPVLVGREAPEWLASGTHPSMQTPVRVPQGALPPSAWFTAVAASSAWPNTVQTDDVAVFTVHLSLAWPIWAGGYPDQHEASSWLEQASAPIRERFTGIIRDGVGPGYHVRDLWVTQGGYQPIAGLSPRSPEANSVDLDLVVSVGLADLLPDSEMEPRIERTRQEMEDVLAVLARSAMPHAATGANLYDVSSRWDAEEGFALLEPADDAAPLPLLRYEAGQAPVSVGRNKVFVSYSHRDQRWLTRLQVHLRPLEQHFGLEVWDDTKIQAGDRWREQIDEAIKSAGVAILLISADFLASKFIADNELPPLLSRAQDDGAVILPVIVAPSMYRNVPELAKFQAVNELDRPLAGLTTVKREAILAKVADRVLTIIEARSPRP